ncbi:MAG: hypothetical protein AUG46_07180 [Acidobacteria bacterium 13_1_20CM_3_58_11]|nr:MAG: hypothetical protein AUG46_07180 [Acidobacteria bacterium 13_1_20CM_3_58_11]
MIQKTFCFIALAFLFCASAEAQIAGDYLESRSADVYTGQCFANGEVGLTGDEAILAWHTVLIVDNRADARERGALAAFARHMGGQLLANVVNVINAPIDFQVAQEHHGSALVRAGDFVTLETRSINENDHLCGNESTFYPPLTQVSHAMAAVAMTDSYSGKGLGTTWTLHDKRSAFVGSF